ncbi:leucine-rich repeat protein [Perkinsela sp. CCAP 1560/4]|nr:leucine-rich repeat protein [Perkinsela sp. CCAP 1560/4]KNH08347.1 leucine-rich repeat protein [Perkinsela sp. CCAP 1560/4]|eukprot:KNH05166.1 leucine-rich repeat protein [Perkinsela sp. CCAP 1560/4]
MKLLALTLVTSVCYDPYYLGRVNDPEGYSDDVLMQIMIMQIEDNGQFRCKVQGTKSLDEWPGLILNETGNVKIIDWVNGQIGTIAGTINLSWCPAEVQDLRVTELGLHGTVDTDQLPSMLTVLHLFGNVFKGTFSTKGLPNVMLDVCINSNHLVGSLNLSNLPPPLEVFDASKNLFSGQIDLTRLPSNLIELCLCSNSFVGPINFTILPRQLEYLSLEDNNIKQDAVFLPRLGENQEVFLQGNHIGLVTGLQELNHRL